MESKRAHNRNILIAVDESENAGRAVAYVGDLLSGLPGFRIHLVTIIPKPSEDYFQSESERTGWMEDRNSSSRNLLEGHRRLLAGAGFSEGEIQTDVVIRECTSIAECILDEQKRLDCGTVVIGRRGISKKEEFIFGSTSSKILHTAKDCAVWVIE